MKHCQNLVFFVSPCSVIVLFAVIMIARPAALLSFLVCCALVHQDDHSLSSVCHFLVFDVLQRRRRTFCFASRPSLSLQLPPPSLSLPLLRPLGRLLHPRLLSLSVLLLLLHSLRALKRMTRMRMTDTHPPCKQINHWELFRKKQRQVSRSSASSFSLFAFFLHFCAFNRPLSFCLPLSTRCILFALCFLCSLLFVLCSLFLFFSASDDFTSHHIPLIILVLGLSLSLSFHVVLAPFSLLFLFFRSHLTSVMPVRSLIIFSRSHFCFLFLYLSFQFASSSPCFLFLCCSCCPSFQLLPAPNIMRLLRHRRPLRLPWRMTARGRDGEPTPMQRKKKNRTQTALSLLVLLSPLFHHYLLHFFLRSLLRRHLQLLLLLMMIMMIMQQ